jgi:uncharacterized protein YaaQ
MVKDLSMAETSNENAHKDELLLAIVQGQDAEIAIDSLIEEGFGVTRLPSVGGFLGRRSATLMIGVQSNRAEEAIDVLNNTCRKRVAFIAVPMENSPLPMPAPTPVTVGGASIFTLEVEHYEEF